MSMKLLNSITDDTVELSLNPAQTSNYNLTLPDRAPELGEVLAIDSSDNTKLVWKHPINDQGYFAYWESGLNSETTWVVNDFTTMVLPQADWVIHQEEDFEQFGPNENTLIYCPLGGGGGPRKFLISWSLRALPIIRNVDDEAFIEYHFGIFVNDVLINGESDPDAIGIESVYIKQDILLRGLKNSMEYSVELSPDDTLEIKVKGAKSGAGRIKIERFALMAR